MQDGDTNISCGPCTIQVVLPGSFLHEQSLTALVCAPHGIPRGIAIAEDDIMVVCETNNDTVAVVNKGISVRRFGKDGTKMDQLHRPTAVAVAPDHHIIVVEGEHKIHIKRFTFGGKCVEISEQIDTGQPPHDVAVDTKNQIYIPIVDGIIVLHPNLSFSHHFKKHINDPYASYSIAIDPRDNVYICDGTGLYKFTCDGTYTSRL